MGRNFALHSEFAFTDADRLGLLAVRYEHWQSGKTALSLDYALENRLLEGAEL